MPFNIWLTIIHILFQLQKCFSFNQFPLIKAECQKDKQQDYEEILELFLEDKKGRRELTRLDVILGDRSFGGSEIDLSLWPQECVEALLSSEGEVSNSKNILKDEEDHEEAGVGFWGLGNILNGCNCPQGPPGKDGKDGLPGLNGISGTSGRNGMNGNDGRPGRSVKGKEGRPGVKGEKGDAGQKGLKGVNGVKGQAGRDGRKSMKIK